MTKLLFHILFKNTIRREKKVTAAIETGAFVWYDGYKKLLREPSGGTALYIIRRNP